MGSNNGISRACLVCGSRLGMKNKENAQSRSDRDGTRTLTLQEKEDGHEATYLEPGRPVTAVDQIHGRRERDRAAGLGSLARANNRAPSRDYSTAACSATGRARTPTRSSTAAPSRPPPSVTVGGRRSSATARENRERRERREREQRGKWIRVFGGGCPSPFLIGPISP